MLDCLPELRAGQALALNVAVERLRGAQLLGRNSSSLKLFSQLGDRFELFPAGKPAQGIIELRAEQRGNHIVIEIEDDGGGLPEGYRRGRGLTSMETRARNLGGVFAIHSGPEGTRLTLEVPVINSDAAD